MVLSLYIHRANAMKDINKQATVKVDNTEDYKPGDKVKAEQGNEYSVIMIILNEYDLSVIKNETGILH